MTPARPNPPSPGTSDTEPAWTIRHSARPGDLGWVVESHGRLYHQEYGFDATFEGYVIDGLHEFLHSPEERRALWVAEAGADRAGSIAVMPRMAGPAQLRWFLVEPEWRGRGLGRELLARAVDFARRRGETGVYLWTLDTLDAARSLYQSLGFTLTESRPGSMGGVALAEERWDLPFPAR